MHLFLPISLLALTVSATKPAYCPLLGPVFPSTESFSHTPEAVTMAKQIEAKLEQAARAGNLTNSVSLQIFSSEDKKSFFKFSHSAPVTTNATHGVRKVTEDSVFRIASNSKLWTMYLLMIKTHGDALSHPITKYVPALKNASKHLESNATERNYGADYARWDQITVGELASHLAGITRDYGQGDLATTELEELEKQGFPVLDKGSIPPCGLAKPCTKEQFFNGILKSHPLAPTSTTPIYSNAAFQILGYVLEEIAGKSYETVLKEELIKPLNLTRSSYSHPDAKVGVIPGDPKDSAWIVDAGDETPAGGLYSSAKDMAAIGRSILNSTLLPPAVTRRWMKPVSHIGSLGGSVGHPWEIISLSEPRVLDLYTKNGDLGGYASLLVLSPDHKVGFTILVAGDEASKTMFGLADQIIEALIPALEKSAKTQAHKHFSGSYALKQKNTTMSITTDSGPGLKVSNWTFGGKDMFTVLGELQSASPKSLDIRLYPTGLNNPGQVGFRAIIQPLSAPEIGPITSLCQTWASVDATPYGGVGLDEFIFDVNRKGEVTSVSARGFRLKLSKSD